MFSLGAYFNLEISPMMVTYHETSPSVTSLLTQCCAIIGGVYSVATITDALIYSAEKRFLHKVSLGKAT
jgi:endoplasmic reticulum-Golgi intermediate compartment protein 3